MSENASASKWGQRPNNPNAHWVKTRELAGSTFHVIRVNRAVVGGRDSFVFECADGALFSQTVGSTIGKQITRDGIPPAGEYTIEKQTANSKGEPIKSPTGYALVLKAI